MQTCPDKILDFAPSSSSGFGIQTAVHLLAPSAGRHCKASFDIERKLSSTRHDDRGFIVDGQSAAHAMQAVAEAFSQCIDILPQKLISTIEEETEYIQAAGAAVPASQSWQQRAEETQHKKCCPGREQAEAMQIGTAYALRLAQ